MIILKCVIILRPKGGFMVKEKVRGNLIVISGPSGCGKGTLCNELIKIIKIYFYLFR